MNPEALSADDQLEIEIDNEAMRLATARTREEKVMFWEALKDLIAQRSPAQVARMEARI